MDPIQERLQQEAARLGLRLVPVGVVQPAAGHVLTSAGDAVNVVPVQTTSAPIEIVSSPTAPVDPPEMKPEWEKEIDAMIAANGGRFELTLLSGTKIRITQEPRTGVDMPEIGYETFKRLSRAASILNAKVTDIVPKAVADERKKRMLDEGKGFWASEHCFVEVEKQAPQGRATSDFSVIAAPKLPPHLPPIMPHQWTQLSASTIVEQIPMRAAGKVVGTLVRTTSGAMYGRSARDLEHKLNISQPWAMSGGYTIEREVYDKYLTEPSTVIKIVRGEYVYLTSSDWIQKYGGVIRQWGSERVVMPLAGNYWLVVDKSGERIK